MNLLETRNVVKQYAAHLALDNVSISIKENAVFGLLGPNGAGKTTLIRIINQITAPDSGEVFFNGRKLLPNDIANIGYLPEERGLYRKMKVGEQALYLAQLKGVSHGDAMKQLKKWFIKFEIEQWWDKKVEELSKGMQQKVQFITTVIHQPKLLIFDEPFSGFDPINTNLLKNEMLELQRNGTTIIFSTHNMASVEEICDEIALINRSKVVLAGEVDEIKERYKSHLFSIETHCKDAIDADFFGPGFKVVETKPIKKGQALIVKIDKGYSLNNLLASSIDKIELIKIEEVIPSMNEIFIKVVGETLD